MIFQKLRKGADEALLFWGIGGISISSSKASVTKSGCERLYALRAGVHAGCRTLELKILKMLFLSKRLQEEEIIATTSTDYSRFAIA